MGVLAGSGFRRRQVSPGVGPRREAYRKVAGLSAIVASAAGRGAAQSQRRAVSLNVPETLAVVALLGLRRARQRAAIGLMA